MAVTLELTDGVTTLDLTTDPFDTQKGGLTMLSSIPVPKVAGSVLRDVDFTPRPFSISLRIVGTTIQELELQIRRLNDMLSFAERRQILDEGTTKVVLKYQVGNIDSRDAEARVLSGSWQPSGDVFHKTLTVGAFSIQGTLNLLMEPFGRLTDVVYVERILFPEDDGNSFNFIDLAGPFNSYLDFPGVDNDIDFGSAAAMDNTWDGGGGKSIRIYADGAGEGGYIITKGPWVLNVQNLSGGKLKLRFIHTFSGDDGSWISTSTVVNVGEWYRVGLDYDADAVGNNPTIFVYREATRTLVSLTVGDGLTETITPVGTRDTDAAANLLIGDSAGSTTAFDGRMDDLRIYDATGKIGSGSTPTEDMDGELVGSETGLIHYWPMDEGGSATVVNNKDTTNTETGTITGATWGIDTSIVGDAMAPLRVKVSESGAYAGAGNLWLATRSGERRTDTLFFDPPDSEVAGTDPSSSGSDFVHTGGATGGLTTNTTGGTSGFTRWTRVDAAARAAATTVVPTVGYTQFDIAGASLPKGLFRVLARCSVEHDVGTIGPNDMLGFGFALGHVFGGLTVTPVAADRVMMVAADSEDAWRWLDLGELSVPPQGLPESAITPPAFNIRVHGVWDGTVSSETFDQNDYAEWACDSLFLLPVDESVAIIPAVPTSGDNVVFASAVGDTPGIWLLTTADVVSSVPDFNGGPLEIGPEVTRLYFLKDDTGDPSVVSSALLIEYEPQIRTL